ncbi:MAG TPA: inositol monophosphatase, partial [Gammaproteobacteria bacterium]|nr:inositol monophosphatase [Gammaproteobacteria bacterium]
MSTIKITQLCDLVKSVCRKELYTRIDQRAHSIKADGSLLTELDLALNDGIRDALAERYPATAFLSEE